MTLKLRWFGYDDDADEDGIIAMNTGRHRCRGGALITWFIDVDSDGYGSAEVSIDSCFAVDATGDNADDCYDEEGGALVNLDAPETCNEIDDNCSGETDEDAIDAVTCTPIMTATVWGSRGRYHSLAHPSGSRIHSHHR